MFIRRYQSNDQTAVLALHEAALKPTGAFMLDPELDADLSQIESVYLQNKGEFLVGELDGVIVAMGAVKKIDETTAEIKRLRVHPDFQRRGFGQTMLTKIEERAKALGYTTLQLDTTPKQLAAIQLYEKNGYTKTAQRPGKYLELLIYKKILN